LFVELLISCRVYQLVVEFVNYLQIDYKLY